MSRHMQASGRGCVFVLLRFLGTFLVRLSEACTNSSQCSTSCLQSAFDDNFCNDTSCDYVHSACDCGPANALRLNGSCEVVPDFDAALRCSPGPMYPHTMTLALAVPPSPELTAHDVTEKVASESLKNVLRVCVASALMRDVREVDAPRPSLFGEALRVNTTHGLSELLYADVTLSFCAPAGNPEDNFRFFQDFETGLLKEARSFATLSSGTIHLAHAEFSTTTTTSSAPEAQTGVSSGGGAVGDERAEGDHTSADVLSQLTARDQWLPLAFAAFVLLMILLLAVYACWLRRSAGKSACMPDCCFQRLQALQHLSKRSSTPISELDLETADDEEDEAAELDAAKLRRQIECTSAALDSAVQSMAPKVQNPMEVSSKALETSADTLPAAVEPGLPQTHHESHVIPSTEVPMHSLPIEAAKEASTVAPPTTPRKKASRGARKPPAIPVRHSGRSVVSFGEDAGGVMQTDAMSELSFGSKRGGTEKGLRGAAQAGTPRSELSFGNNSIIGDGTQQARTPRSDVSFGNASIVGDGTQQKPAIVVQATSPRSELSFGNNSVRGTPKQPLPPVALPGAGPPSELSFGNNSVIGGAAAGDQPGRVGGTPRSELSFGNNSIMGDRANTAAQGGGATTPRTELSFGNNSMAGGRQASEVSFGDGVRSTAISAPTSPSQGIQRAPSFSDLL
eukprot:TRINITY_DN48858_c0_g1_i1.p1 TRINITY_DN48858_c0_g1~~TRINITY_DN48858_c0_g1_i1.p1  ORF type:complete len:681 (-),score=72.21 TRINITY_DN48858_c0_g1_i1:96-2138(-)